MHKMTEESLRAAFAGESQAHMKYLIFAERTDRDHPEVARMFRAIAYAEQIHATNHFKNLGGVGDLANNLSSAIEGETFEVDEMYPAYQAVAELQGEKSALRGINWALDTEKVHAQIYANAKASLEAGVEPEIGAVWVCSVCGFTGEGEAPDKCPLCNAPKDKLRTF